MLSPPARRLTAAMRHRPNPVNASCRSCRPWRRCWRRPAAERITTAALAAKLDVSEAALYRHFASKAQMFEGPDRLHRGDDLRAGEQDQLPSTPAAWRSSRPSCPCCWASPRRIRGMTRVLIGDALVNENERLQPRINQLHDRLETTLKQCLRFAATEKRDSRGRRRGCPRQSVAVLSSLGAGTSSPRAASSAIPLELWAEQWKQLIPV